MSSASKLIYNRYLISLVATMVIVVICFLIAEKYRASILSIKYLSQNLSCYYHDFDNDGTSERIELHRYAEKMASVLVYNDEDLIFQRDFEGDFGRSVSLINMDDYDNDESDEIILITQLRDSLYLSCIDFISNIDEICEVPICKVYKLHEVYAFNISPIKTFDVNNDGIKEFFFSVWTGYTTRPRKMFSYYPAERRLYISPESCAIINYPCVFDLDSDGKPEIFGNNPAGGNCRGLERDYTDMYSWLMVFTPEMEFKFPPVIVGKYPSNTEFLPIRVNGSNYIIGYHKYEGNEDVSDYFALFDISGSEVKKRKITPDENLSKAFLFASDSNYNYVYICNSDGEIFKILGDLEPELEAKIGGLSLVSPKMKDLDGDGDSEYIFISLTKKELVICRSDFLHPVELTFPDILIPVNISLIKNPERKKPGIIVETAENRYTINYDLTVIYKYWYIFILFVYAFCLLVIFISQKFLEYRNIKLSHTRNQIIELQLKSIQNQLDPHFTLNLFQSFTTLITEHDNERAEVLFGKYASLLKTTVLNSEKLFIPLEEELNFITSYLDLEKFRQSDRFSYSIDTPSEIDTKLQIPKMLLFIFVENSLKHGLRHLETKGKLIIHAAKSDRNIQINIIDNGIGRKKAAEYADFSTGKGLSIVDQILELYYSMNRIRITYEIIDLTDDHIPAGTQVNIKIPL